MQPARPVLALARWRMTRHADGHVDGSVKTAGGEILVRTKGRRYYAADYEDVAVITKPDGSKVTLGQIANLKDGFEDVDVTTRFDGKLAGVIEAVGSGVRHLRPGARVTVQEPPPSGSAGPHRPTT